ncbi:MAG: hypothetical protein ACPG4T_06285 [Nannocystaceae bacterium]
MKRTFYLLIAVATLGTTGCDTNSGGSDSNTTEETGTTGTNETDVGDTEASFGLPACERIEEEIPVDQVNPSGFTGPELLARAQMYDTGVVNYEAGGQSALTLAVSSSATTATLEYLLDDGMCSYRDDTTIKMAAEMTITTADGLFSESVDVELLGNNDEQVWAVSVAKSLEDLAGTYTPPAEYPPEDFDYMEFNADVLFGWEKTYLGDQEVPKPPANGRFQVHGELKESGCDPNSSGPCMGTDRWIDIGTLDLD